MNRSKKIRFVLSPFFVGQIESGLEQVAGGPDWQINKPSLPPTGPLVRMAILYTRLAAMTADSIYRGELPVSLAGDCLSSIGVLAGLQKAGINPTVLWFDAHGDFHTWETTKSDFVGGMPLAMLTGRGDQTIAAKVGLQYIRDEQVILTDGRRLDTGEDEAIAASGLRHIAHVGEIFHDELPQGPLYVHFDTDVIDPKAAPAMRYAVPDGPSPNELAGVFRRLSESGRIVAVSVSAWAPELDSDGRSREVSMALLEELISWHRREQLGAEMIAR